MSHVPYDKTTTIWRQRREEHHLQKSKRVPDGSMKNNAHDAHLSCVYAYMYPYIIYQAKH